MEQAPTGQWSVPIREDDREKTAFAVPRGQFEMNVMAFGLCNSQSTYQRVIDQVLSGVPQAEAYIDDACVHTRDVEEHLSCLKKTLDAYSAANMQLRLDKCRFAYEKGEFVGHEISGEGYSPLKSHVNTIRDYSRSQSKKELQRFLRLVNFHRHFIAEMGCTAAPLYKLTHQDSAWLWTKVCETSFESLRRALAETPVLAFPKWNKPFWVEVDTSGVSVGGILSGNGRWHSEAVGVLFFRTDGCSTQLFGERAGVLGPCSRCEKVENLPAGSPEDRNGHGPQPVGLAQEAEGSQTQVREMAHGARVLSL